MVLLDLPQVLDQIADVDHPDRMKMMPADMFQPIHLEISAALLARVIHDWDDERALHILTNVHNALPSGGKVFLVEMIIPEDGSFGGLCDLHLQMASGGRERTSLQYSHLLQQAGFNVLAIHALPALPSIIEGVKP